MKTAACGNGGPCPPSLAELGCHPTLQQPPPGLVADLAVAALLVPNPLKQAALVHGVAAGAGHHKAAACGGWVLGA